jgi:hypothetical protein
MTAPDPKPTRKRGRLPTVRELGGRCQVCGSTRQVERMHLLRGVYKEDDPALLMLGCGDFGDCRVHARHTRGPAFRRAAAEIRAAMTPEQETAVSTRRGRAWLDRHYPLVFRCVDPERAWVDMVREETR